MRVTSLTLQNFKSFRDVTIPFRPFNVVIGGNASGKSNLVQAFQFLKDIADHGLENAVSLQGGVEFLHNVVVDADEPLSIAIEFLYSEDEFILMGFSEMPDNYSIRLSSTEYKLELDFHPSSNRIANVKETLSERFNFYDVSTGFPLKPINEGAVTLSHNDGSIVVDTDSNSETAMLLRKVTAQLYPFTRLGLAPNTSIFETPIQSLWLGVPSPMDVISIYDIEPHVPKRGYQITGKADLESDGSNLAIVLNDILRDKERSRRFHNLIHDILPFVEKASVDRFADNSLMIKLRESYAPDRDIPAPFLSDGTIGMTAVLVAFAFEGNDVTILEEPDKNVHPRLISRLTNLMKDVSRRSQILITTHNPEFVRLAGIENLILVHRDKEGFSRVSRPADSEIVKIFLSEEIGIDDLHVDGFLEFGV